MKYITPINIWRDGQTVTATILYMYISYDNLKTTATFQYELCDEQGASLASGSLNIYGDSYAQWGASGDSNAEAYAYGAASLNLTITGDVPEPTVEDVPLTDYPLYNV